MAMFGCEADLSPELPVGMFVTAGVLCGNDSVERFLSSSLLLVPFRSSSGIAMLKRKVSLISLVLSTQKLLVSKEGQDSKTLNINTKDRLKNFHIKHNMRYLIAAVFGITTRINY